MTFVGSLIPEFISNSGGILGIIARSWSLFIVGLGVSGCNKTHWV